MKVFVQAGAHTPTTELFETVTRQSAIPCTLTHRHTHTLLNHLTSKQQSVPDLRRKTPVAAKGSFSSVSRWQQEDTLGHYAIWNVIAA